VSIPELRTSLGIQLPSHLDPALIVELVSYNCKSSITNPHFTHLYTTMPAIYHCHRHCFQLARDGECPDLSGLNSTYIELKEMLSAKTNFQSLNHIRFCKLKALHEGQSWRYWNCCHFAGEWCLPENPNRGITANYLPIV